METGTGDVECAESVKMNSRPQPSKNTRSYLSYLIIGIFLIVYTILLVYTYWKRAHPNLSTYDFIEYVRPVWWNFIKFAVTFTLYTCAFMVNVYIFNKETNVYVIAAYVSAVAVIVTLYMTIDYIHESSFVEMYVIGQVYMWAWFASQYTYTAFHALSRQGKRRAGYCCGSIVGLIFGAFFVIAPIGKQIIYAILPFMVWVTVLLGFSVVYNRNVLFT